jgi:uncharacterized protein
MIAGTVEQLWRYPVKSMAGEPLTATRVGRRGFAGDRGWAVHDETRQGITGAKRIPALRLCRARYLTPPDVDGVPPAAEIEWPGGVPIASDAPDAARRLGDHVGRPVSLHVLGPPEAGTAPRLTMDMEPPEVQRELNGLLPGEPAQDYGDLGGERLRQLRHGNFFDAYPIHLITRTTLRTLARIAPESDWDDRRFRANVYMACALDRDYPELDWIGRRLRLGSAVLQVAMGCPRCVMVTQAVDGVPQDHRIMRTLVRETRHTAGVYAGVVQAGEVRIGDEIELL